MKYTLVSNSRLAELGVALLGVRDAVAGGPALLVTQKDVVTVISGM